MTSNIDSTEAMIAGILDRATPINDNRAQSPKTENQCPENCSGYNNNGINVIGNNNIIIDAGFISSALAMMLSAICIWLSLMNR